MRNFNIIILLLIFGLFATSEALADKNIPTKSKKKRQETTSKLASGCRPATAAVNLDINNVRARIMNGGDMWWDLVATAKYEVPKVTESGESRKTSLFAGSLWIGGYDAGNNLRLAAMTYRQDGNDFFPGPLDTTNGTIDQTECLYWDKIFKISREEIDLFKDKGASMMTDNIRYWPANPHLSNQTKNLAPYEDVNKDGRYNPYDGDYPNIFGDQSLWFVYNDRGNIHSETKGAPIGLEIQTQAFAFATNDEMNNMTFYHHKIVNRSREKINKVYIGEWVDADLGFAYDDYVSCDTTRDLGICYNGDNFDEGIMGYGDNPPSIGVDFFKGPYSDFNDGVDNDKDGKIDEIEEDEYGNKHTEIIGMSKFVYYNNDWSQNGNPSEAKHYYNYLDGKFKNGQRMRFGGDGFNGFWENKPCNYMFPGDPRKPKPSWSEKSSGNDPADRRFLQSSGKFTLNPGAVNFVVVGVVWSRASTGGNTGSYDLLLLADDKAQKLYNNNFKLIDGPPIPDFKIKEYDQELILTIENTKETEGYLDSTKNSKGNYINYRFQGYQIFQLKNSTVTSADVFDANKARLIARVDVKDGVAQIVNKKLMPGLGIMLTEMVDGEGDLGIKHSFKITTDAFASGNDVLVNYKKYYYLLIAYANTDDPDEFERYLPSRKVVIESGTPHSNDIANGGTILNSEYGSGPLITRVEGTGNGGQFLDLTDESIEQIISGGGNKNLKYKRGMGPLNVYVVDPMKVPDANFEIKFIDSTVIKNIPSSSTTLNEKATWMLIKDNEKPIHSDTFLSVEYEQIISECGLAIKMSKTVGPIGNIDETARTKGNGFINSTMTFEDPANNWLTGIADQKEFASASMKEYPFVFNWIRSGKFINDKLNYSYACDDARTSSRHMIDPNNELGQMLNGIIAPYGLVAKSLTGKNNSLTYGPAYGARNSRYEDTPIDSLPSIDLVFTSDRTKWTKCIVIEMGEDKLLNEGGSDKFMLRNHPSLKKEPKNGKPDYDESEKGMSWFPGYAINVETGQRLNIIFAEDSYLKAQNGRDMVWNPTYSLRNPAASVLDFNYALSGGKHYIYIMGTSGGKGHIPAIGAYDEGDGADRYHEFFEKTNVNDIDMRRFWASALYVMEPMLRYGKQLLSWEDGIVPSEVKIKIRIARPYRTYKINKDNHSLPFYKFSTKEIAKANSNEVGKNAMEKINIVPNPYYARSGYEKNQLDNRVKITNLPKKCKIRIYTLSGLLVRTYDKDEPEEDYSSFIDWDLKNQSGIPVASGLYIIHVDGYELGEKILKWFGVMRPIDLDSF